MKILKLIVLLLVCSYSYGQTIESIIQQNNLKLSKVKSFIKQNNLQVPIDGCVDFPNPNYIEPYPNYSQSLQRSAQSETQYVFNVYFHIINESDGTREIAIGENEVMDAVALLNRNFNSFNIFFKYTGHGAINDSNWTIIENSADFYDLRSYAKENDYFVENAFNIFICEDFKAGAGIAFKPGITSLVEDEDLLNSTLQHEIAHNFLIHHIHKFTTTCEHVNGNNADITGDLVTDTNAAHKLDLNGADNILGNEDDEVIFLNNGYVYNNFSNKVDCTNTPYKDIQVLNYMASNSYLGIRKSFTNGQGVRMRETIKNNLNTIYANVQNSISSLYEPYFYEITGAEGNENINSTKDDPNISQNIIVCRNPLLISKFQKGFDYNFYTFDTWDDKNAPINPVLDFKKVNNEYAVVKNKYKHAIKINQISNNIKIYTNLGGYRGFICKSEPATAGRIVTASNLGSNDISVKNLNEKQVVNPNLVKELEKGKYHTITRTTKSGVSTQKTIYKND
ncbi:hypothetical protein [uncultured Polaribacter sp.]|uniref:hypothetical protein n=1 Tax=uncultured Polaribacter sp. TaxID=174711 RepID=UPI0026268B74|nr:hypothetical protein [uncultured Polaribacter sp.]